MEIPDTVAKMLRDGATDTDVHRASGHSRQLIAKIRKALNIPPTPRGGRRASPDQQAWNKGRRNGKPSAPAVRPTGRDCPAEACGSEATGRAPTGMVRVHVSDSRELARWYCAGGCAAYGQALAEIRAIPLPAPAQP